MERKEEINSMVNTIIVSLILCIIEILVLVTVSPMVKPDIILRFLPEDVRQAAKGHEEPPKSKQMIGYLLLALCLIAFLGGMFYLGIDGIRNGYGFWKLTLRFIIMLYIIKAFDIIVQDQWLVMTLGFYKKIFPETADCEGWKNRGFNNKNQLIRIVLYPFLCMMTAGMFVLFG